MLLPRQVYSIQHNVTKKIYIGSSGRLEKRIANHMNLLRAGKHPVEDMQKDFDEYGENYTVQVLDVIDSYEEAVKEHEWKEKMQSWVRGVGYNYKDPVAPHSKNRKSHDNRKELHKVVDTLSEDQCIYFLNFIKKMLE